MASPHRPARARRRGFRTLWPNVEEQLYEDLSRLHDRCGPWDLALFTGDLTQRGSPSGFAALDDVLGALWDTCAPLGSDPRLFTVPGNHDLARPDPRRPEGAAAGAMGGGQPRRPA
ncbi:MAG: metallophosphoesterase [Planctomycetes bacterium]|nr:metallophosphoesterase [Planctomycetota bacterium]